MKVTKEQFKKDVSICKCRVSYSGKLGEFFLKEFPNDGNSYTILYRNGNFLLKVSRPTTPIQDLVEYMESYSFIVPRDLRLETLKETSINEIQDFVKTLNFIKNV